MAITIKHVRPVTDGEILELSRRNPGYQFERTAAGELVVTPTGSDSGRREQEIALQLGGWAKGDGRGITFSPSTGFRLADGALVAPDASWVRRDRWQALSTDEQERFAPLCPDAVFELRSKHDSIDELRAKMQHYLANGAHLGVLIDPYEHTVEIHRPGRYPELLRAPVSVALEPELPGFVLDTGPIFMD
jgi:Uma2 family endonuclease